MGITSGFECQELCGEKGVSMWGKVWQPTWEAGYLRGNKLPIIGIRFLTFREESYKYRGGEKKNESCVGIRIDCTVVNQWFSRYVGI